MGNSKSLSGCKGKGERLWYEPMKIVLNGEERECGENWTVADLLADLDLSKRRVAVEVNRDIIPRDEYANHRLPPGAVVEVVHFVGGG